MLSPYARTQRMIDSLTAVRNRIDLKLNIADTAAMLSPYAKIANSTSGTGTTNFLPKFTGTKSFGNSLIFDDGTNVGIGTSTPSSLFQIGKEGSTDLNLKYDFVSNTSAALKLGYRQYQWRMKTNTNSGTLTPLVFSYYNGTTDVDRLSITNSGISVPDNVVVGGNISGSKGTLHSLDVNNGQLYVDSTNSRIGLFTSAPSSMFQVGGNSSGDFNLKFDNFSGSGSTLKFGFRQYEWRFKTSQNSGVLMPLVFSYFNGTTDVDILQIGTTGSLTASSFVKSGGTSSQYLMADGTVSSGPAAITDAADEFTATTAQTSFTLSQTPSTRSKVKMYINGIRISNTAYSVSGNTLTYLPANNGSYALTSTDRIQFDYFY